MLPRVHLAAALLLLGSAAASAQGVTGSIAGRVADQSARPVAGATVTAAHRDGSYRRTVRTDDRGAFAIASLPPGRYEVAAQRLGHRPAVVRDVDVRGGERAELLVTLPRAAQELAPLVVGAASVRIDREQAAFATRIGEALVEQLPAGGDVARLVALTPGARPDQLWGGSGVEANAYHLNGVTATNPGTGGALVAPNVSWIAQVAVRGLGAGAAHGGFQGGLVDIITKSGTNTPEARVRVALESHHANGSNLTRTEDAPELEARNEIDAEARGPLVRDRLFYYVSGQAIRSVRRAVDHLALGGPDSRFAPERERADELRGLAKLTWTPASGDLVNASAGMVYLRSDHFGFTGRETPAATARRSAPTGFAELSWERPVGTFGQVDVRAAAVAGDDHRRPAAGASIPGVSTYQLAATRQYQNASFDERMRPASLSAHATWRSSAQAGPTIHQLSAGVEGTRGAWRHARTRAGGMTWRPRYHPAVAARFEPSDATSWDSIIPTAWGGEIDVDATTLSVAAFAEDELRVGRLTLVPGVRVSRWRGSLRGADGQFFSPVHTTGIVPRIGIAMDLGGIVPSVERLFGVTEVSSREPTFVVKAHWGRYHQALFAEMFDRAAGSAAYSDQELWEFLGTPDADPRRRFTVAERDSLAAAGLFRPLERIELAQTGPVDGFRQPYVDQLVIGAEKTLFSRVRVGAAWMRRDNRNLVALVDRNLDANWHRFENVGVFFRGQPLHDEAGDPLLLPALYLRNDVIREILRLRQQYSYDADLAANYFVPGFTMADTARLSYAPDFVLTTVPEARREFEQLQLTASMDAGRWSLGYSAAWSTLRGNLFSVSGYDDAAVGGRDRVAGRGPGPFVRPNEQVNYWGNLENYSTLELKLVAAAPLPAGFRAGAVWSRASGDRLTPDFTVSRSGLAYYVGSQATRSAQLLPQLVGTADGHRIFTAPRGSFKYEARQVLDLRVGRETRIAGHAFEVALEAFNALGDRTVTRVNTNLVAQVDPNFDVDFFDPVRRVEPRRARLTVQARF